MLYNNYSTAKLLGMEDFLFEEPFENNGEIVIPVTRKRKVHICPVCGAETDRTHDYRLQRVRDLDILKKGTVLLLKKRRYVCLQCGKRFAEENSEIPRYYRRTKRSIMHMIQDMGKTVSTKSIATEYHVSSPTVMRYLKVLGYGCTSLPTVLSLDEFKGNTNGEKYQSIIADPVNKRVLDILPCRYENKLIDYFKKFSTRYSVQYFVIDMSDHFRRVGQICFPNAKIVADHYHVVRQVYWAMENVRKREQKRLGNKWPKYFKHCKSYLYKDIRKLTTEEQHKLATMLELSPELANAYRLKNKFLGVMASKNSAEGRRRLNNWLFLAEYDNIPEFEACMRAYHNWFNEIINSFDVPYSNGFIEGCNNRTKVLKRMAYGFRNFDNLRLRVLHMAAHNEYERKKKRCA